MITAALDAAAVAEQAFVLGYPLVLTRAHDRRGPRSISSCCAATPPTRCGSRRGWISPPNRSCSPCPTPAAATTRCGCGCLERGVLLGRRPHDRRRSRGPSACSARQPRRRLGSGVTPVASPTRMVHLAGCVEAVAEREDALLDWARERFVAQPAQPLARPAPRRRATARSTPSDRSPVDEVERMDARTFFSETAAARARQPAGPDGRAAARPAARDHGHARALSGAGARPATRTGGASGPRPAAAGAASGRGRSATAGRRGPRAPRRRRAGGPRRRPGRGGAERRLDADADGRPLSGSAAICCASPRTGAAGPRLLVADDARRRRGRRAFDRRPARPGARPDGSLPIHIQHASRRARAPVELAAGPGRPTSASS